jgi:hypothetical protein
MPENFGPWPSGAASCNASPSGTTFGSSFVSGPLILKLRPKPSRRPATTAPHRATGSRHADRIAHRGSAGPGVAVEGDHGSRDLGNTKPYGTGKLTRNVLPQANAYAMIRLRRRAAAAGIETKLGNHSFRATGIAAYLKNGGTLEKAAAMAKHASTRTTQLYDRRRDEVRWAAEGPIAISSIAPSTSRNTRSCGTGNLRAAVRCRPA